MSFKTILALVWVLLISAGAWTQASADEMTLMAFNVGKADSMLLRSGENAYLIDTGRGSTWDGTEEQLLALGIRELDGVIITHMDSDHVGGLKKMLKSDIQTKHIYVPPYYLDEDGKSGKSPAEKAADKRDRQVEPLKAGDILPLGNGKLTVIGPIRAASDKEDNNSLVLLAEAAGGKILLVGDMEFPEEADLLKAGVIPEADVLKVGNHGDDDATSDALLNAVRPGYAVISTSTAEKTSTPAKRVLEALAAWKTKVYQTQEAKAGILVTIQEGNITIKRVD